MGERAKESSRTKIVNVDLRIAAAHVATDRIVGHGQTCHLVEQNDAADEERASAGSYFARMSFEMVNVTARDQGFHLNRCVLAGDDDECIIGGDDHVFDRRTDCTDRVEYLHAAKGPPFYRLVA